MKHNDNEISMWDIIPTASIRWLPKDYRDYLQSKKPMSVEDLIETIITSSPPLVDNVVIDKSGNITHPIWLKVYLQNNSKKEIN